MAYKFQLGAFVASGSITAEDGLSAGDANITNVADIALDSISADGNDMEINLTDARATAFVIKEGSNVYLRASTADGAEKLEFLKEISGSAALNIGGNLTMEHGTATIAEIVVGAGGLDLQNLSDTAIAVGSDALVFKDADGFAKTDTVADLATAMAGNGLAASSGVFAVGVDDSSIELSSDALRIKAAGVVNSMLADDAVGADELASNAVVEASIVDNAVTLAKMAGITRGSVIVGDASGDPALLAKGTAGQFAVSDGDDIIYRSLSGDATLAANGALTIANDAVSLAKMAGLARGSVIVGDASGDPSALAKGTAGQFAVSDGDDIIYRSLSGDATLSASGALTIGAQKVLNSMLADDAVGADELAANAVVNASVDANAAIAASKIDFNVDLGGDVTFGSQSDDTISTAGHLTVGGNLTVNGSVTSVNSTTINITSSFTFEGPADDHETILSSGAPGADTTLTLPTLSAGSYFLPALADAATDASAAVTAAEFALLDGASSIGTTALAAGDGFMHNDNGTMKQTQISKIGDFLASDGLVAASGKLEVSLNGLGASLSAVAQADSLAVVDADGSNVTKKITFSDFEDSIFGNVSGDATVAAGGALTIAANAVEGSMLNDNVISGQTDFTGTLADTDEMIFSDDGSLKRMDMSILKTYMSDVAAPVQNVAAAGTLVVGVNYFSNMGADGEDAVTLPASPSVGQSVKVKAPSDCSVARYITVSKAGSQTIDGAASIRLESPFAAVELVYVASDLWRVF